jgi:hypothetical protein
MSNLLHFSCLQLQGLEDRQGHILLEAGVAPAALVPLVGKAASFGSSEVGVELGSSGL